MYKVLTLNLPVDYQVPDVFVRDMNTTKTIIELGMVTYNHFIDFVSDKENICEIVNDRFSGLMEDNLQLKETTKKMEMLLTESKEQITKLQSSLENIEKENMDKLNLKTEYEIMKVRNEFNRERDFYSMEINKYKRQIDDLNEINKNNYVDFREQLKGLTLLFDEEKNKLKDEHTVLKEQLKKEIKNNLEEKYEVEKNYLNEKINNLSEYKKKYEENTIQILDLQKRYEDLMDRTAFLSKSSNKGKEAEIVLYKYLEEKFTMSKIFDVSGETASGDLHLHLEHSKILIESKNVEKLQKERDLEKFVRDIQVCSEKNTINCGLFICFNDIVIKDGKKGFIFEFIGNVPVIYISNVINNIEIISFCIKALENIVSSLRCYRQTGEEFEKTRNHIITVLRTIKQNIDYLNVSICEDEVDIMNLTRRLKTKKENIMIINENIMDMIKKDDSLKIICEDNVQEKKNNSIARLKEYAIQNGLKKITQNIIREHFIDDKCLMEMKISDINGMLENELKTFIPPVPQAQKAATTISIDTNTYENSMNMGVCMNVTMNPNISSIEMMSSSPPLNVVQKRRKKNIIVTKPKNEIFIEPCI